jgi:PAS domain S-box-containing protein
MNNRDYTEPETAKKMFEIFNRIYRTGEPLKIDNFEVIKKDRTKAVMELSTSLMRNRAGEAIGFRGISRDVTKRERIKRELKESEEKYRTILRSIEDGYYEVDIKGNFTFFNESMCKILGYSEQELKGMNNRQFMSEETAKRVFETFNHVYRTGEPTKALDWELIRKDGERRYVETSVSLVQNPAGETSGFRGIARDISERKRLEKAKERAINHLAHELGTPLSVIGLILNRMPDELKKGNLERVHEWIERGKRNIRRLTDLKAKVDDILGEKPVHEKERILNIIETAIAFLDELKDESMKEGGEAIRQSIIKRLESLHKIEESGKETIVLDAFIDQVCQEACFSMQKRQLEIVQKVEKGICVEMDPKVLKKVCEGFLKNAIENTPDEGKIQIELRSEGNLAKLSFRDFGMGITPENQRLIFSGFFHTQDTNHYASKKPYLFNAGGSGSDLLRTKVLSERFGFSVGFTSTRCSYLSSDRDDCPGSISLCPHIKGKEDCLMSGGSTFSISMPMKRLYERPFADFDT